MSRSMSDKNDASSASSQRSGTNGMSSPVVGAVVTGGGPDSTMDMAVSIYWMYCWKSPLFDAMTDVGGSAGGWNKEAAAAAATECCALLDTLSHRSNVIWTVFFSIAVGVGVQKLAVP